MASAFQSRKSLKLQPRHATNILSTPIYILHNTVFGRCHWIPAISLPAYTLVWVIACSLCLFAIAHEFKQVLSVTNVMHLIREEHKQKVRIHSPETHYIDLDIAIIIFLNASICVTLVVRSRRHWINRVIMNYVDGNAHTLWLSAVARNRAFMWQIHARHCWISLQNMHT